MFERYAIYYTPTGPLGSAGAAWLGWDTATGSSVDHPEVADLDLAHLTKTPRKYGFHATLKPPFHLSDGQTRDDLEGAVAELAETLAPVHLDRLEVTHLGRFLALTPVGDQTALSNLAGACVTELDRFRAPPSDADLARRRRARLTPEQDANLIKWGYPFVLNQFRFHMTLTGRLDDPDRIKSPAVAYFQPVLPEPFVISDLTLAGQDSDGMFHQIRRFPLMASGQTA